ncbi:MULTISPECIES: restriction endonuclease [Pontibacillus]|uniref:Restriction endonuclease n=1 Tax=Pontibacillus chungwhensis TaxID=265426 RepID=A0ABY8UYA9_9BACI|nr:MULTISPECIES: restriction endonuclease [Pontibacillus]MCD5324201.1 restriction endonuclease [Pontibacillus sp. HN14]WIF97741.1 restriction endonuclease [Pontibacillus chungwhensis]
MFAYVKEALEAVKAREENVKVLHQTEKRMNQLTKKNEALSNQIEMRNEQIEELDRNIARKESEIHELNEKMALMHKEIHKTKQEKYDVNSQLRLAQSKLEKVEEEWKKHEEKKEQYERSTCERKVALTNLVRGLSQYAIGLQEINSIPIESEAFELELMELNELHERLMENFVSKYLPQCVNLIIPDVFKELLNYIDAKPFTQSYWLPENVTYAPAVHSMISFYHNHLTALIDLLSKRGLVVRGNEEAFLEVMKLIVLEVNYERLRDDFFLMEERIQESDPLDHVLHVYIQSLGEEEVRSFSNLGFLVEFLKRKRYGNYEKELLIEDDLLNEAQANYKAMKLERDLMRDKETTQSPPLMTMEAINEMNGLEFEEFLVSLLSKLGFRSSPTKNSGDQGVDILARKNDRVYAIQAKRYASSVGNKAVQEVVSGKEYYHADATWVITNNTFTPAALALAERTETTLWDGHKLEAVLEVYNM